MTRSLTLRALVLAALTTGAALVFLWVLLTQLFEQRISQRYFVELEAHLAALERGAEPGPAGVALASTPQTPDFARPFSGLYWQVEAGGKVLTSRSWCCHSRASPGRSCATSAWTLATVRSWPQSVSW